MTKAIKENIYNRVAANLLFQTFSLMQKSMDMYAENPEEEVASGVVLYYATIQNAGIEVLQKLNKALEIGLDEKILNTFDNIQDLENYLNEVLGIKEEDA